MRIAYALSIVALLSPCLTKASPVPPLAGKNLLPLAHLSLSRAKAAALGIRPGDVVNQELKKEAGGSGLRYSFDIRSAGKVYEVGIDARSGRLLENTVEGPHLD